MRRRAAVWLLLLAAASATVAAARAFLHVQTGLSAEYFKSDTPRGTPSMTVLDGNVSDDQVVKRWSGAPPSVFSVRWFGYVAVTERGTYSFALTSDDGSRLWIDGGLIVDNGGRHGPATQTGSRILDPGLHNVLIEYVQLGGDFQIRWAWSRDNGPFAPIPSWRLTPTRIAPGRIVAARFLDIAARTAIVATVCLALSLLFSIAADRLSAAHERARQDIAAPLPLQPRRAAAALALFVVLAVIETWPLASSPGHLSRNDNGDTVLNEWTLAWVAHQAPRAPLHLFDANIFYPERNTLAYSEAMIVQAVFASPILWLGGSPVLAYNLVLIVGFALTGWAMCLVITKWTHDWSAGLVSGTLFAFNAHSFTRLPHLQAQHVEFLPFALLALDRLLRRPTVRHAVSLGLWFVVQALTSVYLLVFAAVALTTGTLARPEDWLGKRFGRVAGCVALAAVLAIVVLAPFLLPYWRVHNEQGLTRTLDEAALYGATWHDYLSTPGRFHYHWWSARMFTGSAFFPGFLALLLVLVAVWRGVAFRDRRARMCVVFGMCGIALSFGTRLPGYALLYAVLPPLHAIRMVSRFGYLSIVAVAVVAGFGVVELRKVVAQRAWTLVTVVMVTIAALEPLAAPIEYTPFTAIPRIYDALRDDAHAVVVEVPFYGPPAVFAQAPYMLDSTRHWRPMLNGYSGFQPESFYTNAELLANFPDPASLARLQSQHVTHVFVHTDVTPLETVAAIDRTPALHRLASEGPIVLYLLDGGRQTDTDK